MHPILSALLLVPLVLSADETDPGALSLDELEGTVLWGADGVQRTLGELVRPADTALVLTYTGVGCPISGKLAPRIERLRDAWSARGVRFLAINANPQDTLAAMVDEARTLGLGVPLLKDARQELTRRLGATTTTEVFLFDGDGVLRYRGAVDDQYSLGAARPAPTRAHLELALGAVLAGEAPEVARTEAPGCLLTLLEPGALAEPVSWSGEIAAILQNNCETCHRPGQVGPFPLQTYEQARGWGRMIASVVEEERMPPWNADHRFDGQFVNERRLTSHEREALLRWVAEGMPRGNPDEDPAPATWAEGWRIGEPDAVFQMELFLPGDEIFELRGPEPAAGSVLPPEGFAVPREGTVEYQYFLCTTDFPEDRWIQALEVRPGAADVVHHVLIGAHDFRDGPFRGEQDLIDYLAVAVPGDTPSIYPEGYAKRLPAGATLVFQLHYTPNGKERFDRSSVGMIFAEEEPIFEVVSEAVLNQRFQIPAGAPHHEVRGRRTLTEETGIISFFPHMHTRGKDFRYVAHYPDGSEEELLFTHYDFNWQESYIYPDPKPFPEGTVIECVGHYDNSAANPNNPDPTRAVRWGDQTWEEMFVGYYDHVVPLD